MHFGTYCLLRIFWAFQISQKGRWLELFHWQRLVYNEAKTFMKFHSQTISQKFHAIPPRLLKIFKKMEGKAEAFFGTPLIV